MAKTIFDFSGEVIVITGAAGGIGAATAGLFSSAGGTVVLADIDHDAAGRVARDLTDRGGTAIPVRLDSTDPSSIDALVALVASRFGRIDHLVPAAGIYPERLIVDMPDSEWTHVLSVNLDGVFMLVKRALPLMAPGGTIVTIASVAGHRGSRGHSHYAVSKAGIIALTRSLALEAGPEIRVNAVSPGSIDTAMIRNISVPRERLVAGIPLDRVGTPQEVASAIAFLASDAASYIQGAVLHVNGGLFMAG